MGYCDSSADERRGALESVYKFRWRKRKTKVDGCLCSQCNRAFPKGTVMHLKRNRWNDVISVVLCSECFGNQREGRS